MANNTSIISTALSFNGKLKYVFGGNNIADGYGDCSDFTEYVYLLNGLNIGADTGEQYKNSRSVGIDNAKAGDLIFWKNTYNSGKIDGVSHVGIWLGDGRYIDLNENTGCAIHDFNMSPNFLDIRRPKGVTYNDNISIDYENETVNTEKNLLTNQNDILKVIIISICLILVIVFIAAGLGIKNIVKGSD